MKLIKINKSNDETNKVKYMSITLLNLIGFSFMAGLNAGVHIQVGLILYSLEFTFGISQWEIKQRKIK